MVSFRGLGKPQYLFRPAQILKRLLQEVRSQRASGEVRLPWGLAIALDSSDTVSEGIFRQGVYDIVTSELLWRLTAPGDCAVDIGANIGYMTSILAVRTGRSGSVFAFEPHPRTFAILKSNVERWSRNPKCGAITAIQAAISDKSGMAILEMPQPDDPNASHARVSDGTGSSGIEVPLESFASYFAEPRNIGIVKVDAEGHEAAVFAGMGKHLGRIRDIVYEEWAYPAPSHATLEAAGYTVFGLEEHLFGPRLRPASGAQVKRSYDIPSYLATMDRARTVRVLGASRWQCLTA